MAPKCRDQNGIFANKTFKKKTLKKKKGTFYEVMHIRECKTITHTLLMPIF